MIQNVEREEYDPRFVECERRHAVTDNLGIFKIQGSILGLLKIATCKLIFLPCFFLQFFFTSFSARDRSYLSIFRLWQNVLLDKVSLSASVPVVKQPNNLFLM